MYSYEINDKTFYVIFFYNMFSMTKFKIFCALNKQMEHRFEKKIHYMNTRYVPPLHYHKERHIQSFLLLMKYILDNL